MKKSILFLGLLTLVVVSPLSGQDILTASTESDTVFRKSPVADVNTPSYLEIRPLVTADGNTLYFNRRSGRKKEDQDIYVVYKDTATGTWGEAKALDQFNNKRMNAIASVNPIGHELVLFNTYKNTDNVPLVRTIFRNGKWTEVEEIYIKDYENYSPYSDFYVDFRHEALLMGIQPYNTEGGQDLYVSFPEGDGWSKPLNMGPVVNSEESDFAPFMAADGRTLFFSSFGHDTHGGSDIFMSVRLDDSWTNWSAPVNLGPEINTEGDENYFSMDKNMENMYYSSQNLGEELEGNVVQVALPEDFAAINGPVLSKLDSKEIKKIMDSGNYKINPDGRSTNAEGVAIEGWPEKEEPVAAMEEEAEADSVEGEEAIAEETAAEDPYMPERLRGFKPATEVTDLSEEAASLRDYLQEKIPGTELQIRQQEGMTEFKLVQNILYDFNSVYPKGEYYQRLNNISRVLREKGELKVQLIGHTDSIGSQEVNEEVARMRVRNIQRYLTERGVSNDRIEILGAGQGEPIAPNETDEGRDMNRRVETIIRLNEK